MSTNIIETRNNVRIVSDTYQIYVFQNLESGYVWISLDLYSLSTEDVDVIFRNFIRDLHLKDVQIDYKICELLGKIKRCSSYVHIKELALSISSLIEHYLTYISKYKLNTNKYVMLDELDN